MKLDLSAAIDQAITAALAKTGYTDPGVAAISAERARVLGQGRWTTEHDRTQHTHGELVDAAICYLIGHGADKDRAPYERAPGRWPWDAEDFRPGDTGNIDADRLRDLERAGQLIAAEITRLSTSAGLLPLEGEQA